MISVCFPPEKDESRVFLLFICPGVLEIWAPLHSTPGSPHPPREEKRDRDDLGWETTKRFK